jgi:basic amino acid/polyamine antiporter, APA family
VIEPDRALRRGIGRFDAVALVVGSMIGSGIFIVSAESARLLGSGAGLLAVWTIAGLLTMAAAVSCAELAAMLPRAGGQYVFFREAYGPLAGFLFGWAMLLVIQTGTIAAVAAAFARFLEVFAPGVTDVPWARLGPLALTPQRLVAIGVILLLTATNATGLRAGTLTQNVFTTAKLAGLLALALGGLLLGSAPSAAIGQAGQAATGQAAPVPGVFALALAAALVGPFFSQSAWNNVTFAGEEVRDPGRTLPRALVVGCLIVTTAYVLTNVAYLKTLGLEGIMRAPSDRVGTAAAGALFGGAGTRAMAAAILISTFGCVNGLILSGARVSFAMARDGHFFERFARVNRAAVPGPALWLQAAWASLLVLSGTYSQLLKYVVSADLLLYVLLVLAVPALRRKLPEMPRPFRAPGYPWLQLAYAAAGSALIVLLLIGNPKTTWPGYALLASGLPVFFLWRRGARS